MTIIVDQPKKEAPEGKHTIGHLLETAQAAHQLALDRDDNPTPDEPEPEKRRVVSQAPEPVPAPRALTAAEQKVEAFIAKVRKPIEARAAHVAFLRSSAAGFRSIVDDHLANPRQKDFPAAHQAATGLLGTEHLLERFGTVDVGEQLRDTLNASYLEGAPLLLALIEEEYAYLKERRSVLRELKIAEATLHEPIPSFTTAIRNLEAGISAREGILWTTRVETNQWVESGGKTQNNQGFQVLYNRAAHVAIPAPIAPTAN
jgi:hypothetical protein